MARAETDSTIEKGVKGVGEGSVCASVLKAWGGARWGEGGYDSPAELDSL